MSSLSMVFTHISRFGFNWPRFPAYIMSFVVLIVREYSLDLLGKKSLAIATLATLTLLSSAKFLSITNTALYGSREGHCHCSREQRGHHHGCNDYAVQ